LCVVCGIYWCVRQFCILTLVTCCGEVICGFLSGVGLSLFFGWNRDS